MTFYAYILRCADDSYYTGHTDDLDRRIAEHQSGLQPGYTQNRRPIELMWSESFPTREEALAAESQVKNWSRAKKEALIAGDWKRVGYFARPPHERPSTSLGTSDISDLHGAEAAHGSLVPNEVEEPAAGVGDR